MPATAAMRAAAAPLPSPSSASRRKASRLLSSPPTWSLAISSAMYCRNDVTLGSMRQKLLSRAEGAAALVQLKLSGSATGISRSDGVGPP